MKKYLSLGISIILLSFLFTNCQDQAKTNKETTIFDKTDIYLTEMMDSLDIIGLNYAILINGKVVHKKAMGLANFELQVPMKENNLFAVASISKLFSSTALHRLLKDNDRSVDETVADFLPNRSDLPESWQNLTLKQLITHTSGIPDQIDYQIYLAPESDEFVIEGLKEKPFTSTPGEENKYNATGFMLVGLIIEELAGQDLETHMQENYFSKFNLTTANYGGFKKVVPNRVTSYRMLGEDFEIFPLNYSPTMYAAAGLNINMDELITWLQAVLDEKIVSKEYLETIWAPVRLNNNEFGAYGLGWETYDLGNNIWFTGHGGAGISSVRHYYKEDSSETVSVILLTNGAKKWIHSPDYLNIEIANYFIPGVSDSI